MERVKEPPLSERLKKDSYLINGGLMVFTEAFHLKRGLCCGNGCRHCPYEPRATKGSSRIRADIKSG